LKDKELMYCFEIIKLNEFETSNFIFDEEKKFKRDSKTINLLRMVKILNNQEEKFF